LVTWTVPAAVPDAVRGIIWGVGLAEPATYVRVIGDVCAPCVIDALFAGTEQLVTVPVHVGLARLTVIPLVVFLL
jgi:hypothetical protein